MNKKDVNDAGELAMLEASMKLAASDYQSAYRRWTKSHGLDVGAEHTMRECEQFIAKWLGEKGEEAVAYLRRKVDEGR